MAPQPWLQGCGSPGPGTEQIALRPASEWTLQVVGKGRVMGGHPFLLVGVLTRSGEVVMVQSERNNGNLPFWD